MPFQPYSEACSQRCPGVSAGGNSAHLREEELIADRVIRFSERWSCFPTAYSEM